MVVAIRNGERRSFSESLWSDMPSHRYGWVQVAEEPQEVRELRMKTVSKKDIQSDPNLSGLEGKVIGVPESEKDKIERELQNTGLHHMVRKKLEKRLKEINGESD